MADTITMTCADCGAVLLRDVPTWAIHGFTVTHLCPRYQRTASVATDSPTILGAQSDGKVQSDG